MKGNVSNPIQNPKHLVQLKGLKSNLLIYLIRNNRLDIIIRS